MTEIFNNLCRKAYIKVQTDRDGMEALEWIAIAAAFVILIFLAYRFFGTQIRELGNDIFNDLS